MRNAVLFMILPILLAETALTVREVVVPAGRYFYHGVSLDAQSAPADVLFIGSSRVAAIHPEAFQKKAQNLSGRGLIVRQVAMGCSTMAEHYFGLRHLVETAPWGLRGCTVIIEAPLGLGDDATWEDSWVDSRYPTLIAPYLKAEDVARLLRISNTPWIEKLYIACSKFSRSVYAFSKLRSFFYFEGERLVRYAGELIKTFFCPGSDTANGMSADLASAAGIRADAEGVRQVRKEALLFASRDLHNQVPRRRWDRSVVRDIIDLVRAAGGDVHFFEMPLSSVQAQPLETVLRREDKKIFEARLSQWQSKILRTELAAGDEDFPDLYHLRKSRNNEFSERLAEAYFR